MAKRAIWLLLAGAILAAGATAWAQVENRGLIIRVLDRLVYIDLGQRDGVQAGDLFDIVSSEVLSDPLSGDTLAVTPQSVGALRVRQVYEKMSLAEILYLEQGIDPMLMKIELVRSPERLVEIESKEVQRRIGGRSMALGLVPGLHQFQTGKRIKGLSLMALESASLAAGIAFRISSNDWKERYDAYRGPDIDYVVELGEGMQSRRRWSNRCFWVSGVLYACNWLDVLWTQRRPVALQAQRGWKLGLGMSGEDQLLLQMTCLF